MTFRDTCTLLGFWDLPLQTVRVFGCRLLGVFGGSRGRVVRSRGLGKGGSGHWGSAHLLLQSLHLGHQMLLLLFLNNPRERTKASFRASLPPYYPSPTPGTHLGSGPWRSKAGRMGLGALMAPAVPSVRRGVRGVANRSGS